MRKIFIVLVCCLLLCSTVEAKVEIKEDTLTLTSEQIGNKSYTTQTYSPSYSYYTVGGPNVDVTHADQINVSLVGGQSCSHGGNIHNFRFPHLIPAGGPEYYALIPSSSWGGLRDSTKYDGYNNNEILWEFGENKIYRPCIKTRNYSYTSWYSVRNGGTISYGNGTYECPDCDIRVNLASRAGTCSYYYGKKSTGYSSVSTKEREELAMISNAVVTGCTTDGVTLTALVPIQIKSGNYKGGPAVNSNRITIDKGTLTDSGSTHSTFVVGDESEAVVTTGSGQTITTVKLSNPPVIIDWADFPG